MWNHRVMDFKEFVSLDPWVNSKRLINRQDAPLLKLCCDEQSVKKTHSVFNFLDF